MRLLEDLRNDNSPLTEAASNVPQFANYHSKNRKSAVTFFKYVYFLHSPFSDNPYKGFPPKSREEKLNQVLYGGKFIPTKEESEIISLYDTFLQESVPILSAFRSAHKALNKLASYLDSVDFSERDSNGKPVYDVIDVSRILKEYPMMLASMAQLEKAIGESEYALTKTRGNRQISYFEEPEA